VQVGQGDVGGGDQVGDLPLQLGAASASMVSIRWSRRRRRSARTLSSPEIRAASHGSVVGSSDWGRVLVARVKSAQLGVGPVR
jgi:hypothetical protein